MPSLLLRIGFVGETGWEIHFPADYGEYLWSQLLEAGKKSVDPLDHIERTAIFALLRKFRTDAALASDCAIELCQSAIDKPITTVEEILRVTQEDT